MRFAINGKTPILAGVATTIAVGMVTDLAKNIVLKKVTQYAQHIPGYDQLTNFIPGSKKRQHQKQRTKLRRKSRLQVMD